MKKRVQIPGHLGDKLWEQLAYTMSGQLRFKLKMVLSNSSLVDEYDTAAAHCHLRKNVYCHLRFNSGIRK